MAHGGLRHDSRSEHTQPWLLPAGKFILNFGILELLSLVWIGELARDDALLDVANDLSLARRLRLIGTLISRGNLPSELEREVLETWGAVSRLSR